MSHQERKLRKVSGNSLVVPWLRTHLPLQGTQVPSPENEDPMCLRAIKPLTQQASNTEPACHNREPASHVLQLRPNAAK